MSLALCGCQFSIRSLGKYILNGFDEEQDDRFKGSFRPIMLETLILRYGLKEKARTRPDFIRVVFGPCAQFYPREASEQKWG